MITRKFKNTNGIKIFDEQIDENHLDYNAKGLDSLYAQEEKHFWFIARKEFILQNMKKFVKPNEAFLEIGAGTGNVSRYLKKNGYQNISVGEMHLRGLQYAQTYGIKNCYQFDLLNSPFENEFAAIGMFDVLEHIEDDALALKNVHKTLKDKGKILLTVPSHMWLWNRADAIAGHKRRYTRRGLIKLLKANGFEILFAKYFFTAILPLFFLRKLLEPDTKKTVTQEEYQSDISMNPIMSTTLLLFSRIENKLSRINPACYMGGGSLLVIARKK